MRVCGFSFVRNALENDYPVVEAVRSVLPLCDEFQLVVADSTDGTLDYLEVELDDPRVVITTAPWDDGQRDRDSMRSSDVYQPVRCRI